MRSTQGEATQVPSFPSTTTGELLYIHIEMISTIDAIGIRIDCCNIIKCDLNR